MCLVMSTGNRVHSNRLKFKKLRIISLLTILMVLFTSCDTKIDFEGDEYGDTIVRGKVVDKSELYPLDSVRMEISFASFMGMTQWDELDSLHTDSVGYFYIDYYCSEDYSYFLYFHKDGYTSQSIPIESGKNNYYVIEMGKKDSINASNK